MEHRDILFGEIRKYCSRINRVSICMQETLFYENYESILDVPKEYDNKYLYGFGVIDSEFDNTFKQCVEIMLAENPRRDLQSGGKREILFDGKTKERYTD